MPNGKPGDHPFTDIMHHGSSEFGDPVDGLVKELSVMPGFNGVRDDVSDILWQNSPIGAQDPEQSKAKAFELLKGVEMRLQGDAENS